MIILLLLILGLLKVGITQDAVLDSRNRFEIQLNKHSAYHQVYLIQITMADFIQEWSTLYLYHQPQGNSIIDLEFSLVNKHFPEKNGHQVSKCRVEDSQKPFCKAQMQNINFHSFLIKLSLECVTNCKANITIGFTKKGWDGLSIPQVLGSPIQGPPIKEQKKNQKSIILFKILGMMALTLVLVLLAIRFAEKIAFYFDKKVQQDRLDSINERPIMTASNTKKNQ